MHELPVTQSILEIALRHAQAAQARRVTVVHIVAGELSTLVDDTVQFYWDIIAKDTPAEGARLNFKRIAAELGCQDCQHHYRLNGEALACPQCGSRHVQVLAGEELYLEAIEIEE